MNKIYKVIYCKATQTFVAVSEFAKGQGKGGIRGTRRRVDNVSAFGGRVKTLTLAVLMGLGFSQQALAEDRYCVDASGNAVPPVPAGNGTFVCGPGATTASVKSIAIGDTATVGKYANQSIAMGKGATVVAGEKPATLRNSYDAIALGTDASVKGNKTIAIGTNAAVIQGVYDPATDTHTGNKINTVRTGNSIAIGQNALVAATKNSRQNKKLNKYLVFDALAIGSGTRALDGNATAVGHASKAHGYQSVALGSRAIAKNQQATAIGNDTVAVGLGAISIGGDDTHTRKATGGADQPRSFEDADGASVQYSRDDNGLASGLGVGFRPTLSGGIGATSIGVHAQTLSEGSVAIGIGATAGKLVSTPTNASTATPDDFKDSTGKRATAIGAMALAQGKESTAIGVFAKSTGDESLALGSNAEAKGVNSSAMGYDSTAYTESSIAIGNKAVAGHETDTTKKDAIAIGTGAKATGNQSISIGYGNVVSGNNSGAFGDPSIINGANSYSIGNNNTIGSTTSNAFALGNNIYLGADAAGTDTTSVSGAIALGNASSVTQENGVALGSNSQANRAASATGTAITSATPTAGTTVYAHGSATTADKTAISKTVLGDKGAVSVGNEEYTYYDVGGNTVTVEANTRQITNLAAGAADTDAVNVAQLKAVATAANRENYFHVNKTAAPVTGNATNLDYVDGFGGAKGIKSTAAGVEAQSVGLGSVAVGYQATTSADNAVAIGSPAGANKTTAGTRAVAIGYGSQATLSSSIAIGSGTRGSNTHTVALGTSAKAQATQSTAIGYYASTTAAAEKAVAIGTVASARQIGATAIGNGADAWGKESTALGHSTEAKIKEATAVGGVAIANAEGATSIGHSANTVAKYATALGKGAQVVAAGVNGTALGYSSLVEAESGIAIGDATVSTATAKRAIAIGNTAQAKVADGVALGSNSVADRVNAPATAPTATTPVVGTNVYALEDATNADKTAISATVKGTLGAVSVGKSDATRQIINVAAGTADSDAVNVAQLKSVATAANRKNYFHINPNAATATGNATNLDYVDGIGGAKGGYSLAAGLNAQATEKAATAVGYNAQATGSGSVAIGGQTGPNAVTASGTNATAINAGAKATNINTFAMGYRSEANTHSGVAIGAITYAKADATARNYAEVTDAQVAALPNAAKGYGGLAMGVNSEVINYAGGRGGVALGTSNLSKGKAAVAIGAVANATADSTIAIGEKVKADQARAVAMGKSAQASVADGVALGSSSVANRAALTVTAASAVVAAPAGNQVYAIGSANTADKTAIAGTVAGSLGAVSIGQSGQTRQITNVAAGRDNSDAVNVAQLKSVANTGLVFAGNEQKSGDGANVTRKLGETLTIYGAGKTTDGTPNTTGTAGALSKAAATTGDYSAANLKTVTDKTTGAIQIQFAENPEFTSVKIGDATNNTTLTSTANGLDVGGDRITNVDKGKGDTDAVNVSQLRSITTALGGGSQVNADGTIKAPTYSVKDANGNAVTGIGNANNVGDALTNLNTYVNKGFTIAGASTSVAGKDDKITPTNTLNIVGDTGNTVFTKSDAGKNIYTQVTDDDTITIGLANELNVTSVQVGDTILKDGSLVLNSNETDSTKQISLTDSGLNSGGKQITNVASGGTVSTNAANIGDLTTAISSVVTTGFDVNADKGGAKTHQLGKELAITAGNTTDKTSTDNLLTTVSQDASSGKTTVAISMKENPEFTSVKIGDATNSTTLTSTANGLDVGGDKVTNIGKADITSTSTDAVRGDQIKAIIDDGFKVGANSGSDDTVPLGSTLDIVGSGTKADSEYSSSNIKTVVTDNKVTVNLANAPVFTGKVSAKGFDAGSKQITNVASGLTKADGTAVDINSSDLVLTNAVNTGDLQSVATGLTNTGFGVNADNNSLQTHKLGKELEITAGNATGTTSSDNLKTVVSQNASSGKTTVAISMKENPEFTSVKIGDATNNTTLTSTANGLDVGGDKITNVAAGDINATSKDAVNGSQLFDTNNQVAGNTTALGGGAAYNPATDTYTKPTYNTVDAAGNAVAGINSADNVGDALSNLNTYVNKGFNVQERGTTKGTVTPTESINFVDGTLTTAKVSTEASGVTNITFDVDAQNITQTAQTPVVYTKADGTKVYKYPDGKFYDVASGGTAANEVAPADIIASMQDAAGNTTAPTRLGNVASTLPATYNTVTGSNPITTAQAAPTLTPAQYNNAATIGDVLNSGWNIQGNAKAVDFVKAYDTVNFVDGEGTTVDVISNGTTTTVKYDLNVDTNIFKIDNGKLTLQDSTLAVNNSNTVASGANNSQTGAGGGIGGGNLTVDAGKNLQGQLGNASGTNTVTLSTANEVAFDNVQVGDVIVNKDNGINAGNKQITGVSSGLVDESGAPVTLDKAAGNTLNNAASIGDLKNTNKIVVNNSTNILANTSNVAKNMGGITDNSSKIAGNSSRIAGNSSKIAGNSSKIAGNSSKIAGNSSKIADNSGKIADNSGKIADNSGKIADNSGKIADNSGKIAKGFNFAADSGNTVNRQLGEAINITGDGNISTKTTADGVQVKLNPDLSADSVTTGNTKVTNKGVTVGGGSNKDVRLTADGLDNGGNTITNVAPGVHGNDAVNVNQLNGLDTRLTTRINKVEDGANAGTASALAAANLPQPHDPGASMVTAGMGYYEGEGAFAVGISTISDNGRWILKGSATVNTQSNVGVGVGVGYQW